MVLKDTVGVSDAAQVTLRDGCPATLHISQRWELRYDQDQPPEFIDNSCTGRCQLSAGHDGKHHYHGTFTVSWADEL